MAEQVLGHLFSIDEVTLLVEQGIDINDYVDRIDGYQVVDANGLIDSEAPAVTD